MFGVWVRRKYVVFIIFIAQTEKQNQKSQSQLKCNNRTQHDQCTDSVLLDSAAKTIKTAALHLWKRKVDGEVTPSGGKTDSESGIANRECAHK